MVEAAATTEVLERPAGGAPSGGLVAVRITRPEQAALLLPLAEEFHRESRFGHIPFAPHKLERLVRDGLRHPESVLGVFIRNGPSDIVGLLQASVGEYYLGEGVKLVTVQTFYVPRAVRETLLGGRVMVRMMRIITDWAKAQRAAELHMHSTSGIAPQRTDAMLRRLGFRTYGGCYALRFN